MSWTRITELSEEQKDDLHRLFRNEGWAKGRSREAIGALVNGSDEIVALGAPGTDELVAFARVLTDYVYKAFVFDVIIASEHRGTGLGRRVMEAILEHPALSGVDHVELYCHDETAGFYEQFGFSDDPRDLRLLRYDR